MIALPLITTRIAEPLDVSMLLNVSDEQFNAIMEARYGPNWQIDDELEQSAGASA